jgi:hypothetical protein
MLLNFIIKSSLFHIFYHRKPSKKSAGVRAISSPGYSFLRQQSDRNIHRSFAWIHGPLIEPHRIYGSKLRPGCEGGYGGVCGLELPEKIITKILVFVRLLIL